LTVTTFQSDTAELTTPENWDETEANIARHLSGYEPRPQQQRLARTIEAAVSKGSHLLAQAGCGTGKSIGGTMPMILAAVQQGKRVVVATMTKALQEQYASKDLPFMEEFSGIDFTWKLLKGRSNYVCRAKLNSADAERLQATAMIRRELAENPEHSGDFEHFSESIDGKEMAQLSTSSAECPSDSCPLKEMCFAETAKKEARKADVVITNTAMLLTDAQIRSLTSEREQGPVEMLGHYELLLVDEAHELGEAAGSALGTEFTAQGVATFARDAMTWAALQGEDISELSDYLGKTLEVLSPVVLGEIGHQKGVTQAAVNRAWFVNNFEPFMDVRDAAQAISDKILRISCTRDKDAQETRRKMLETRGKNIAKGIEGMLESEDHIQVRWIETYDVRGETRWRVKSSPVDVAPFLKEWVWDMVDSATLMSATLTSGTDRNTGEKDFTYIKRTLGLWDAQTVDVGTPFDFGKQALMFVPAPTQPSPKEYGAWMNYSLINTLRLIDAAKGGALLLFTSRKAMKEAYENMAELLGDKGYTTLMQGDGRTNKELARIFKEDTHSVLFALKTFFVGVDVPGDACRLVVIDKLPFPVPSDPIFAARSLKEEREGRRSFNSLSIPIMILTLEQGIGRLIRSKTDRGVVAVMDSRLSSTPYGRQIVTALPDFPVTTSMDDIERFFAKSA
jgi:ATP-dependent DNA helicase DinG